MPILPLPQFEADLLADQQERDAYAKLSVPKTLVVRFGAMKLVGEFPWDSQDKPGCGSKIVIRSHRGTEIGEMLTSTCPNSGCSKSVSRQEMLQYIENSGGRDYPFFTEGRALRVATKEDLDRQAAAEQSKHGLKILAREFAERSRVHVKIVDAEPILGGESITFYYLSEERVDFHDLIPRLREHLQTRVEFKLVGARDEARLTADYERCGQYCCCKNFLKVLKPVSMKSAKVQKATLDPLKISGRCGRLMCCLRYEDETYDSLRKNLPKRKSRVGTPEGDGTVIDSQILTQLVLVELDIPEASGKPRQVAVPVENLTPPVSDSRPPLPEPPPPRPDRRPPGPGPSASGPRADAPGGGAAAPRPDGSPRSKRPADSGQRPPQPRPAPPRSPEGRPAQPRPPQQRPPRPPQPPPDPLDLDDIETDMGDHPPGPPRGDRPPGPAGEGARRRRRRRRGGGPGGGGGAGGAGGGGPSAPPPGP